MNLSGLIQSENLFQVSVQSGTLEELFNAFNKKIKNQESRISELEKLMQKVVTMEYFDKKLQTVESNVREARKNITELAKTSDSLPKKFEDLETRFTNMIEDRAGEIMMTTGSQTNSAISNLQATFETLSNSVKDFMKRQPKNDIQSQVNNIAERLDAFIGDEKGPLDIDGRIKACKDEIYQEMENRLNLFSYNLSNVMAPEDEANSKSSHTAAISKMKIAIAKLQAEVDELRKSQEESMSFFKGKSGDDDDEEAADPNSFPVYQKNVERAMMAINEALNNIISEGAGLGDINYVQLSRNAPALFTDDYTASEPEKVGDAKLKKKDISVPLNVKNNNTSSSQIIKDTEEKTKPKLTEEDIKTLALRVETDLKLEDMKSKLTEIEKQNSEVLSALERKVDREFDERLFEKFRVYITQLRDSVNEVNGRVKDLVTHEELETVRKIAVSIPTKVVDTCSVGRRGPECLFCGRPKTSVAGSISARAARNLGTAPVATQAGNDIVYGNNQGFQYGASQSITKFDLLPPIGSK